MQIKALHLIFALLALLTCLLQQVNAMEPPPLTARVNDYAGMLSPSTAQSLERTLAAFEQQTTNQLVLLTVPSLEGDTIENFAIRVGESWKIGQKGSNNGVLLILAKNERKIRIEVGTGLQGALPDITAGQIIRNVIAPPLRKGDFDTGISAGIRAIIEATNGEFKAPPPTRTTIKKQPSRYGSLFLWLGGALLISLLAAAASRKTAAVTGGISLPLAIDMSLGATHGILLLLAVVGALSGLALNSLIRMLGGGRGGWGGGPTIFYGGGGGSAENGGGFSGGGGDFDGGGSSDNW